MAEHDVLIVGAGVAGLSAAARARALGLSTLCLEALDRPGGRVLTTHPAALGGAPFDHGASWLHDAERNPLAHRARVAGEDLVEWRATRLIWTGSGPQTAEEDRAFAAAWDRFDTHGRALANAPGPDRPLSAVADALSREPDIAPFLSTIEAWEGPIIDAAEADAISLRDWVANAIEGVNLVAPGGLGHLILRLLLPGAGRIEHGVEVLEVAHDGEGVSAKTTRGTVRARAAIVTASTAALPRIRFQPPLPEETQRAIESLPLGLAIKVGLRASGEDRLGFPSDTALHRRLGARGEPSTVFSLWPLGRDHVTAWIGGDAARAVAHDRRAAEDAARGGLADLLGHRARAALQPGAVVTDWQSVPSIGGAYSNAVPGAGGPGGARAILARPMADGRLVLAGEACHQFAAATVGGAWWSGQAAAEHVAAALGAALERP